MESTYEDIAFALLEFKKYRQAEELLLQAQKAFPNDIKICAGLAHIYVRTLNYDKGLSQIRRALEIEPDNHLHRISLIYFHWLCGSRRSIEEAIDDAIKRSPENADFLYTKGLFEINVGRITSANQSLRAASQYEPGRYRGFYDAMHELAVNVDDGTPTELWPEFGRWFTNFGLAFGCHETLPVWDGTPCPENKLLLFCTGGYGDLFQFIRYIPIIKAKWKGPLLLKCQSPTFGLFRSMTELAGVIDADKSETVVAECNSQFALMDAPVLFRNTVDDIPNAIPYIKPDTDKVAQWRDRMVEFRGVKVGICWAGSQHRPARSYQLKQARELCSIPNATFVNLMFAANGDECALMADWGIKNLMPEVASFDDTAAIIANLDLVITIDTSIGHLAGAIGTHTWLLLSKPWGIRWLDTPRLTSWYPNTVLYRQQSPGDWPGVLKEVACDLAQFVKDPASLIVQQSANQTGPTNEQLLESRDQLPW